MRRNMDEKYCDISLKMASFVARSKALTVVCCLAVVSLSCHATTVSSSSWWEKLGLYTWMNCFTLIPIFKILFWRLGCQSATQNPKKQISFLITEINVEENPLLFNLKSISKLSYPSQCLQPMYCSITTWRLYYEVLVLEATVGNLTESSCFGFSLIIMK